MSCDSALVLMAAVHFAKRPDLRGSLKLINPAHVLRVLAEEQRDAAMALERDRVKTLLFLHNGAPARLFFGDPNEDPQNGSIENRLLSWAFNRIPDTRVAVFTNLSIAPDPDASSSFVRLDAEAQPPPPATVSIRMDRREVRRRPFSPPEMIIGRDPRVDLFIDNLGVSRRHAKLWWERGQFMLTDLGSSNGTRVNGQRIESAALDEGDEVTIGKFQILIEEEQWEPQVPETLLVPTVRPSTCLWLAGKRGSQEIDRDLLLGRGRGVDVMVQGWRVGPVHARLSPREERVLLTCFENRKVEVNGEAVSTAALALGDELVVGRSRFRIAREADGLGSGPIEPKRRTGP
jgi:pSer/pThr/pTyr-binding forkhead associated (FHA) protein